VPGLVPIGPAVWPSIMNTHTHTHTHNEDMRQRFSHFRFQ